MLENRGAHGWVVERGRKDSMCGPHRHITDSVGELSSVYDNYTDEEGDDEGL